MLTAPWALLGLIAVPIVFGIYFFRTRSRRREVSSLFLWVDRNQARQGGRRIQRLQLPLLIFLELLALILLAVAAARPMIRIESLGRPTAIILDASYSMTAGTDVDTVRQRALDDLYRMFSGQLGSQPIGFPAQFIVAGVKPQLLPGRARNAAEAREILESWTCDAPSADLDAAVSLASNITTPGTKILVVTDRSPKGEIAEGRVLWKSYGRKLDNFAIIHASRVYQDGRDRLLLEIANLSDTPQPLKMSIVDPRRQRVIFQDQRSLEAGETHLIRTGLPAEVETLEVRLDDDALAVDNHLTILPPSRRPVRVKLGGLPADLSSKVRKAVEATGMATIVEDRPEIVFGSVTETEASAGAAAPWQVHFITESDAEKVKAFIGPFVLDHGSPLTTGLSLDGVVWSAGENAENDGLPIISAGDVPLLSEIRRRTGARILTFRYNDRLSTLSTGPAWPILVWNILKYRAAQTVGFSSNNLKLGTEAEFVAAEGDTTLEVVSPKGETQKLTITAGSVRIPADQVGVYRTKTESGNYDFAVGTLSVEESNLLQAETVTVGNWFDEETLRNDFHSVVWGLLLATLTVLTIHHWFISTSKAETRLLES